MTTFQNSSSLNFEQTCLTLAKGQDCNLKIDSEDFLSERAKIF